MARPRKQRQARVARVHGEGARADRVQSAAAEAARERAFSRAAAGYVAKVAALMVALYSVYYYTYPAGSLPDRMLQAFLLAQTKVCALLIGPFDPSVRVAGTTLIGRFPIEIVKDCSSLDVQALVTAAVLAFPAAWRKKLFGLAFGLSAVLAANSLRIAALYFVGAYLPRRFDPIHEELMPLLLV